MDQEPPDQPDYKKELSMEKDDILMEEEHRAVEALAILEDL